MTELEYWTGKKNIELTKETQEKFNECVERIQIPELQQFVITVVTKESNELRVRDSVRACEVAMSYLKATNMMTDMFQSKAVELVIAAILLHNVYFTPHFSPEMNAKPEDFWIEVYTLRNETSRLADYFVRMNTRINGLFDIVYEYVEAQLGEKMPVRGSRPVRGQDTHLTWEILWLYYTQIYPLQEKLEQMECSTK